MKDKLISLIEDITPLPVFLSSSFFDDLALDSLDCVALIIDIGDAFNIEIPDVDAEGFILVSDVLNYVIMKGKQ